MITEVEVDHNIGEDDFPSRRVGSFTFPPVVHCLMSEHETGLVEKFKYALVESPTCDNPKRHDLAYTRLSLIRVAATRKAYRK